MSGRGMWRYHEQLTRHIQEFGASMSSMPESLKPKRSHFLQLATHEMIEPFFAAFSQPNLLIYPFNVTSTIKPSGIPIATVVHDLIFLAADQQSWGARYRRARIQGTIESSKAIITVSKTIQTELSKTFPDAAPSYVIPCHLGNEFTRARPRPERNPLEPRILHLGGTAINKGTRLVLQAFRIILASRPRATLIIGAMSKHRQWLESQLNELSIPPTQITILPRMSDSELATTYASVDIHCMPSSAEGFGLPIIEAASQYTPNVLSPLPVFREILGEAANYLPSRTPEAVAETILNVLQSDQSLTTKIARKIALDFTFANIHAHAAAPSFLAIANSIDKFKHLKQTK